VASFEMFVFRARGGECCRGCERKALDERKGGPYVPPSPLMAGTLAVHYSHNYKFESYTWCCERCDPEAVRRQQADDEEAARRLAEWQEQCGYKPSSG
jgi:hypothetical protein